jgi:hypothetical protein
LKPTPDHEPSKRSLSISSGAKTTSSGGRRQGTSKIVDFLISSRHRVWLFGLFLIVITIICYEPAWNGKPIWDDDAHLTPPELRSLQGLERIWIDPVPRNSIIRWSIAFFGLSTNSGAIQHWVII